MRYIAPYGTTSIDAPYINGNAQVGIQGSIPPAEAFEDPMRELVAIITNSGITPDETDLEQVTKAVRSQRINYAVDTGAVNALSVAYDPPFVALTPGLILRVLVSHANTGAANITVNNLVAAGIKRATGANLLANDLVAGEVVELVFDGTFFQITNYLGYTTQSENNNFFEIDIPYTTDTGTPNNIVAIFSPVITTLAAGDLIEVKIASPNTGATTILVNAISSKTVKAPNLANLTAGQIVAGQIALMVYDGTAFQLINPVMPQAAAGAAQILKRFFYQDPAYHITNVYNSFVEAFRCTFVPVAAGDKLHVEFTGAFNSGSGNEGFDARSILGYVAYSVDGGTTWNPSGFPGSDYPIIGTFAANTGVAQIKFAYTVGAMGRIDNNFMITGEMTVPAGPPASIIFRMMFGSGYAINPTTTLHGGTIAEVTEYSL